MNGIYSSNISFWTVCKLNSIIVSLFTCLYCPHAITSSSDSDTEEEEESSQMIEMDSEPEQGLHHRSLDHNTVFFSDNTVIKPSTHEGTAIFSKFENQSPPSEASSCSANKDEIVYDEPVIVTKKLEKNENIEAEIGLKDIKDPTNLFDDPGYTRGLMATSQAEMQASVNEVQSELGDVAMQVPPKVYRPSVLLFHGSSGRNLSTRVKLDSGGADRNILGGRKTEVSTPTQMKEKTGRKSRLDSIQILEYQDDELKELDPDIASCLISSDSSENLISYV